MWHSFANLHLDDYLKMLALFGASLVFIVGLWQYRKAQQWKRAEFLAQEMKDFFAAPRVQKALLLIDWGCREISLLEDIADQGRVKVNRQMQTMGLRPHTLLNRTGSDPETFSVDEGVSHEGFTHAQRMPTMLLGVQRY